MSKETSKSNQLDSKSGKQIFSDIENPGINTTALNLGLIQCRFYVFYKSNLLVLFVCKKR